jgi:multidrug efflux pump subunit AcrA (membrane-fusion protein)
VGKGDLAERIAVRVGNGDAKRVEVTGSLAAGDRVVVRGGERLRQGQSVKVAGSIGKKSVAAKEIPRG